ncbi:activator-dependent family glycosyltransferase [Actinosynnema sp. NPDC047251]|uniref:Glycosyltransferase, family 1 n=1 Tax=Saccharothrix espanaensis (strain ATCC 51144 / DSM 44229 / JCM 9112 / NBRC 15066 / NRRL 15764) TaxID=1179773 RepID=K0K8J1_SACES|nr:activator-dependent family glycosyltransferase [Saccharothrix espanaensis]CCH33134.1 Glycosyltransferase, family 1 [Saccharothrix espanaensis DSM 44229]
MRVLFTCHAERTHFLMLAPLAWALRTAGHEVRFAVQPKLVDEVTRAGLTAVPVGGDLDLWTILNRVGIWLGGKQAGWPAPYDAAESRPEDVTWEHLHDGYANLAIRWHKTSNVPMIPDLVAFARAWKPDLVVWEPLTQAGSIAAKACGAAHARLLVGADVYGITRDHYLRLKGQRPPGERADPLADWLGSYARKYGGEYTEDMATGHFTIDSLPRSLSVGANLHNVHMRHVQYGGPAVVPRWLWDEPERPRVAITMGLTVTDRTDGYPFNVAEVLDALSDLDVEVVGTITDEHKAKLPAIPDNARLVPYVPLAALLPTCAVAVHHAGVGTLATTAMHGVPQLTLPWDVDQPALSNRLVAQGAGLSTHATAATGASVRASVVRLLAEPSFTERARALRAEMLDLPTPNQLVPRLEELTAKYRADG